jgi:hypothetical protein
VIQERRVERVDAGYHEKYGRRYAGMVDTINDEDHGATTRRLALRKTARANRKGPHLHYP